MKVKELIQKLVKLDPEADLQISVGWADDSAFSDEDKDIDIFTEGNLIRIHGSNTKVTGVLKYYLGNDDWWWTTPSGE